MFVAIRDAGMDFIGSPHHFILASNESIGSPDGKCKKDIYYVNLNVCGNQGRRNGFYR